MRQPVVIYEPYIGGTHDEKMFRVVKDRERWFGVVMGETPDSGEVATDRKKIEFRSRLNWPSGLRWTYRLGPHSADRRPELEGNA